MYGPLETTRISTDEKSLPHCPQCQELAAKMAQQTELISALQAQVASQQQELSSRDFVSLMYQ